MVTTPRLRPVGDRATILDFDDLDEATRWWLTLSTETDATLGAKTVLVRQPLETARRLVATVEPRPLAATESTVIEIPVRYGGPDLAEVARITGLTEADVVAAHIGATWHVGFAGFAPGFAYLVGGDPRLRVPRLDRPRQRVPAGAVGLAGDFSGVYPRESPGGWQLIGETDAPLWDLDRDEPALLRPGAQVQFTEVGR